MTDETGVNALSSGGEEKNGVVVKPLAWHERLKTGDCEGFVCSEGGVLSYSIMLSRFRVYGISGEHDGAAEFPSIEEAKAASQVDYEKRILSALTNTDLSLRAENERLRKERDEFERDYFEERKARYSAQSQSVPLKARLEEAAKVLEKFNAHYPMGVNPFLDDAGRAAKSFLAKLKGAE